MIQQSSAELNMPMRSRLQPRVFSFDVFDSVLTRAVAPPHAVFLFLGVRVTRDPAFGLEITAAEFAATRRDAERRAYRNHDGIESHVTIADIYAEVGHALTLDEEVSARLVEAELHLEGSLIRAHSSMATCARELDARGDRVVFVSDTYLPEDVLASWLEQHLGLSVRGKLYVSNRHAASKRSGRLFEVVAAHEGVRARDVLHVGNDLIADVQGAKRSGARASWYSTGNLGRYETLLATTTTANGLAAALAGASRLTRLRPVTGEERPLWDVAAEVAAPFLCSFALWLLKTARKHGIQRLYFLAREGQVPLEMATVLAQRLGLDLDMSYLCVSRVALNTCVLAGEPGGLSDLLWAHVRSPSPREVLQRVGLDPESLVAEISELVGAPDLDRPLSAGSFAEVRRSLESGTLAIEQARAREGMAPLLNEYLEDADFFGRGRAALVDLSGTGSQMIALNRLRGVRGCSPARGLLAYRNALPVRKIESRDRVPIQAWFYDAERGVGLRPFPGFTALLETLAATTHGSVVGYERTADARAQPIFAAGTTERMQAWGVHTVHRGLRSFLDELVVDESFLDDAVDVRPALLEVLSLFWRDPSRAEARAWGGFPLEIGTGAAARPRPLARPLRGSELIRVGLRRARQVDDAPLWLRGSVRLNGRAVRTGSRILDAARRRMSRRSRVRR